VRGAGAGELAVRDDHRLVRCLYHGHGGIEAGVRAVDHDAQLVALGDHLAAEPAQPGVHRRLGLHVTDLIGPVVHQGQHGDADRTGLLQPPQVTVEEVTALTAQQHQGPPVAGGPVHLGRRCRHLGVGRGYSPADRLQLAVVIVVRLAGPEVPVRPQPGYRVGPQHR
jgi:hypothetical protein